MVKYLDILVFFLMSGTTHCGQCVTVGQIRLRVQDLELVSPTCSVVDAQYRQRNDSSSASGTWKAVSELLVIADQQPGVVGRESYRGNCFNGGNSIMRESGLASRE